MRDERRHVCCDCGGPCGLGTRRRQRPAPRRCASCQKATKDVRRSLAEGLWAQGWPWKEIAGTLSVSYTILSVWRADGCDLPYRYKMVDGRRVA